MDDLQTAYASAIKLNQDLVACFEQQNELGAAIAMSDELIRELGRLWANEMVCTKTEFRP